MTSLWIRVGITLGIVVALSASTWLAAGSRAALLSLVACLAAWVGFQLWHLHKMTRWLEDFKLDKTPTGLGTWDLLYSSVHRLARSYERQQQQLSAALTSFRGATEAMPDGVVALDIHNQINYASQRAAEHLSLRLPTDQGRNILNLLRHPAFADYVERRAWDVPVTLHGVPTADRVLQAQLVPYGEQDRLLLTRDVTSIERLETTRRDFVANVSHELKTPLTVLAGFLETLQELPLSAAQIADILSTMSGQTRRMQRLIDDLLTLSRLESAQEPLHEAHIEMSTLLHQLASEAQLISRGSHTIETSLASSADLRGDVIELTSAFWNLVTNAIRYTPAGGCVTLRWAAGPNGEGIFCVADTGPGIEAHHLSRLAERFYRADKGRSRDTGGTGLGLAIVKHIGARHGAQLEIQSELRKGSTFSLIFPAARCQEGQTKTRSMPPLLA